MAAEERGYDAFISYSHRLDAAIAARLQAELQRFAKPWYQMRAIRVFRDQTSLAASPHLWATIEQALDSSRWLILMASPESAQSPWVAKEIGWWREHRPASHILIAVTDGELVWDASAGDLDWAASTALSKEALGHAFQPGTALGRRALGAGSGRQPAGGRPAVPGRGGRPGRHHPPAAQRLADR